MELISVSLTFLSRGIQVLIVTLVAGVLMVIPGGGIMDLLLFAAAAVVVPLMHNPIDETAARINVPVFLRRLLSPDSVVTDKLRAELTGNLYQKLAEDTKFRDDVVRDIRDSVSTYVRGLAQKTEIAIRSGRNEL